MTLDPRIAAGLAMLPPKLDPAIPAAERRAELRARVEGRAGTFSTLRPPLDDERDLIVPSPDGGVRVRVFRPREGTLPCLLYIHGGAWWLGSVDDTESRCRKRAVGADCAVVSIDYRLAPEHPFPAGLDDCTAVARWVYDHPGELDIDPHRIIISGESAGGNLAAAVALRARDAGGPPFVAQVLEIPATDLTLSQPSVDEFGKGFGLDKADITEAVRFYLGDHDPRDPYVSPLYADLHELPPALIFTAEYDPVRDDGEAYAAKLTAAGVPVELQRWEGIAHGCGELDEFLPDIAGPYGDAVLSYLRQAFSSAVRVSESERAG